MNEYYSLKKRASDEFVEKKSRFIGYGAPAVSEAEALAFISEIRGKHRDATHNVYAYILRENNTKRFSDDGEPGGTAGVPMLDVLEKSGLTDCVVVGTRYFGGTLLGAGGLVRAYSHTARIAVDACGTARMTECALLRIVCGYDFYQTLLRLAESSGVIITDSEFLAEVVLSCYLPASGLGAFGDSLHDLSRGKYRPELLGKEFRDVGV